MNEILFKENLIQNDIRENSSIEYFYYLLTVHLTEDSLSNSDDSNSQLKYLIQVRKHILRSVMYIFLNPFF